MVDRNVFGPHMWATIHYIALGYPEKPSEQDKKNYSSFYNSIANVIPCEECSKHLRENITKVNISEYLETPDKLFEWTVLLHNIVNKMLGKPEWTLQRAVEHYKGEGNNCSLLRIVLVGLLAVGIGWLYANRKSLMRKYK